MNPRYRWELAAVDEAAASALVSGLGVSGLVARCLANRGFSTLESARLFLAPRLQGLADPFLVQGMGAAVDRLWRARERDESVVLFGDYDVDGVTATALLSEVLGRLGWKVRSYLPRRLEEGYGLSQAAAANCLTQGGVSLMVSIDCGSTSAGPIGWLAEQGVEVIVLDHHQLGPERPCAVALVNPRLEEANADVGGAGAELCSVGLAFKLAHAILKTGRTRGLPEALAFDLRNCLDLVALGTIADVVPLRGENRILVRAGLEWLSKRLRPGLRALAEVAGVGAEVAVYEVGFQFAPRLNAAGRLEGAEAALALVQTREETEARRLARDLDGCNRERQSIERRIADAAIERVRLRFEAASDYVIVEGDETWHIGVVGIVASRVVKEFGRPAIVLGGADGALRGSGRSIDAFDLAAALRDCDDLLDRHGGHRMAAGLTIQPDRLAAFRERINGVARRQLSPADFVPVLRVDAEVGLGEVTEALIAGFREFEPIGHGNPPVHLMATGLRACSEPKRMGKESRHARFRVTDGRDERDVVWWRCGELPEVGETLDVAFVPEINDFNGRRTVQLKLIDWRR